MVFAADLHLSVSEKEYSLQVLERFFQEAIDNDPGVIVLGGDTFNSKADIQALWTDFEDILKRYSNHARIILIPGNHDSDLPDSKYVIKEPAVIDLGARELVLLPWPYNGSQALDLGVSTKARICVAHGSMSELGLPNADHVLSTNGLLELNADFYLLGHIHKPWIQNIGGKTFAYPGSMRVVRKGEAGERYFLVLDDSGLRHHSFNAPGQYREFDFTIFEDDTLDIAGATWEAQDFLHCRISGLNIREYTKAELARLIRKHGAFRKISIDSSGIIQTSDFMDLGIYKDFERILESSDHSESYKNKLRLKAMSLIQETQQ